METKELNMETKISLRSIAGWQTGFKRIESIGDVTIPPEGRVTLPRSEVIAQIQSGNRLLTGTDERGSHATLFIDDKDTRVEVDFETNDGSVVQNVLTTDAMKKLFSYKTIKAFEENLKKLVVTRAEKYAVTQFIRKEKINEFDKVRIVENYTGYKI